MTFARRVKILLEVKGAKQKDLAKFIGVGESVVSRWLKGMINPHLKYVRSICLFLGTTPDVLVMGIPIVDELLEKYDNGLIR